MDLQRIQNATFKAIDCCVYLIHLKNDISKCHDYKFGYTTNFGQRWEAHRSEFGRIELVKIFPCADKSTAQAAEKEVKALMEEAGILKTLPKKNPLHGNHEEIITVSDDKDLSFITGAIEAIVYKTHQAQLRDINQALNNVMIDVYHLEKVTGIRS